MGSRGLPRLWGGAWLVFRGGFSDDDDDADDDDLEERDMEEL